MSNINTFSFEKMNYIIKFYDKDENKFYVLAETENDAYDIAINYQIQIFIGYYMYNGIPCNSKIVNIFKNKLLEIECKIKCVGPEMSILG
ncbi:hypothetical protein QLL95_gp0442 [Cotonvirus japonicus]|uniref:Uncharacterized protein n=1 Tax=Cotonvirus japonicus TaxID=2811091 RepID=A0ABM7NUE7_9VIRU|nr:hypothetical protein QLL95_gp0442 [Cotonvirus japonicus]BCS83681.1 hypothetical protein [Cotonvirus japonicus]